MYEWATVNSNNQIGLFAGSLPGRTRTLALAIYVAAETEPAAAIAMSVVRLFTAMALLFFMKNNTVVG